MTTGFTIKSDIALLDLNISFWVLALLAENKFGNEAIQIILELGCAVFAIDDPTVIGWIDGCLSTELEAEVLDDILSSQQSVLVFGLEENLQAGGRARECATLLRLTTTVLIPLPLPSTLDWSFSIL